MGRQKKVWFGIIECLAAGKCGGPVYQEGNDGVGNNWERGLEWSRESPQRCYIIWNDRTVNVERSDGGRYSINDPVMDNMTWGILPPGPLWTAWSNWKWERGSRFSGLSWIEGFDGLGDEKAADKTRTKNPDRAGIGSTLETRPSAPELLSAEGGTGSLGGDVQSCHEAVRTWKILTSVWSCLQIQTHSNPE